MKERDLFDRLGDALLQRPDAKGVTRWWKHTRGYLAWGPAVYWL